MKRTGKERVIFDNYSLWELEEAAKENLLENGIDDPTEDDIWDEVYEQLNMYWDDVKCDLKEFINDGSSWIIMGHCGLWYGNRAAGTIFNDFEQMFVTMTQHCDYWKIYDVNGHLHLECSHHDGTNHFEIKRITDKGVAYLKNWEANWSDKRSEQYVHEKIMSRYSVLPRFAEKVYGCKRVEYETKCA